MQPDWQIWLDAHPPSSVAKWTKDLTGWDVRSAYTLQLYGVKDSEIIARGKAAGNVILVTKDQDFKRFMERGIIPPPKVINRRVGNMKPKALWNIISPKITELISALINLDIDYTELH